MPFNKICRICGKPFIAKRQRNKVCSPGCNLIAKTKAARRQQKKVRVCAICGKEFVGTHAGRLKPDGSRRRLVCSEECRREAITQSKLNGAYVPCEVCGTMTWKRPYNLERARHYYCGDECREQSGRHRWWDTSIELAIDAVGFPGVVKTSGGKRWINVGNVRPWNPDFIVEPLEETHRVIEAFGRNWHDEEDEKHKVQVYAQAGYQCLVLWEEEIKDGSFIVKVQTFLQDKASGA